LQSGVYFHESHSIVLILIYSRGKPVRISGKEAGSTDVACSQVQHQQPLQAHTSATMRRYSILKRLQVAVDTLGLNSALLGLLDE
jgi:hypothetical protein